MTSVPGHRRDAPLAAAVAYPTQPSARTGRTARARSSAWQSAAFAWQKSSVRIRSGPRVATSSCRVATADQSPAEPAPPGGTTVDTRPIGALQVSVVGLGCNNFGGRLDAAATQAVVNAAFDDGITLFDTADVYGGGGGSEELLGRALGSRRDRVVVATKFGMGLDRHRAGAHPDDVRSACEASLRRLGCDHIDLYQLHRPDPEVPIAETLGALDGLVAAGKVREIGHSNLSAEQADEAEAAAQRAGTARFVCAQDHWSLLSDRLEDDVLRAVERHGLALLPFFP